MALGTAERPLRVAVVGAGPAGFYVAEHLLRRADLVADVDMFDRLPTPSPRPSTRSPPTRASGSSAASSWART
jgi:cation diffusion facilitator CzcD-associated flavoprotein CzcO